MTSRLLLRMEPNTGPMQGVQPKAKATPSRKAPTGPLTWRGPFHRRSVMSIGRRRSPRHRQTEDNDQSSADQVGFHLEALEKAAEGHRADKQHEYGREPEHEQQRRAEDVAGYRITAAGRAGATSDIGQVARHERQDAG